MSLAADLIAWQRVHGRHTLPWQNTRDPYRIWLSEIMLQQTQVSTVIGYYERFLARFPNVAALAAAPQDDVLALWAGLGYYARARNLHKCAQTVMQVWNGRFPTHAADLITLPGIGRSTAAAVAAFAAHERSPIMDGNVKRVFSRYFAIEGDPGRKDVENRLWTLAETQLPEQGDDMPAYTQGLMDLGATLCTRSRPSCTICPLQGHCQARIQGRQHLLPTPRARKAQPRRSTRMLIIEYGTSVLLQRRPAQGIWGGLWSLPEADESHTPAESTHLLLWPAVHRPPTSPAPLDAGTELAAFEHVFTHFRLTIQPWLLQVNTEAPCPPAPPDMVWTERQKLAHRGLPAPVEKLLSGLYASQQNSLIDT